MSDCVMLLQRPGGLVQFRQGHQTVAAPGKGELRIRHDAIGVNFLDIYHRQGLYPLPKYPAVIGAEAAGIVEHVGPGVSEFVPGDRVAYAGPPVGAYRSARTIAADRVVKLPETISTRTAASSLLKGMTAYLLLEKVTCVGEGMTILVHAAAGGLGSLLVRSAKARGATVIGTAGSAAKAERARAFGADHMIVGREADVVAEVGRITAGQGVDIAYDGIGGDMLGKSIRSVRPFGTIVTIGQAAGAVPPLSVEDLRPGKTLTYPSIMAWCADVRRYRDAAQAALHAMEKGIVSYIAGEFDLKDAMAAHIELESGRASGSILLIP